MKNNQSRIVLAALSGLLAAPANAAITYVDATEGTGGNTRATGSAQNITTWTIASTSASNDTKWSKRDLSGSPLGASGGTIFQALPNGSASGIPELTTTVSGLAAGTYNIWVFFQDNTGDDTSPFQNWVISTGLTSGSLTTYWAPNQPLATHNDSANAPNGGVGVTTANVSVASSLTFAGTAPVLIDGAGTTGERRLYGVNLGSAPVTTGSVDVFVGMNIDGGSSTTRVWYDGVGYELIPEPSTALLGAIGALSLLRRRRH